MAKYVTESKELLNKLVKFENEGYLASIDFEYAKAPKQIPSTFQGEQLSHQEALNKILYENYCLRLRVQCLTEVKRWYGAGVYLSGQEVTMQLYEIYQFKVTFP